MRDELVALNKTNQELADAFTESLELVDDLAQRLKTLEAAFLRFAKNDGPTE